MPCMVDMPNQAATVLVHSIIVAHFEILVVLLTQK